jgi:hypothetical protein
MNKNERTRTDAERRRPEGRVGASRARERRPLLKGLVARLHAIDRERRAILAGIKAATGVLVRGSEPAQSGSAAPPAARRAAKKRHRVAPALGSTVRKSPARQASKRPRPRARRAR